MPSPITAQALITTAMRKIGVLAVGETPSADQANDGLQALNDVLETWSIDGLAVYNSNVETFSTVAGTATYTIGVGAAWSTARPVSIDNVYCTVQGIDFPIANWTLAEYDAVGLKTQQQQIPERFVYINDFPYGQVILWPVPSSIITISIDAPRLLTQVASLAATINLPPTYVRALQYAVGLEMSPDYGSPIDVSAQARATMAKIKRANRVPRIMGFDAALMDGGRVIPMRGY